MVEISETYNETEVVTSSSTVVAHTGVTGYENINQWARKGEFKLE